MAIRIFNNISSLNSNRALDNNNSRVSKSVTRIASGIRVSRSADDPASFAVSEHLRSDTRVLRQAEKNATAAISMLNITEGALNESSSALIRLKELASQAATGTIGTSQRDSIQLEFSQLLKEVDRIAAVTEYNGKKLIDGSLSNEFLNKTIIALGMDSSSFSLINLNEELNLTPVTTNGLGINSTSVNTQSDALLALRDIDEANISLSKIRGRLGSTQRRMIRAVSNLNISVQSLTFANSTMKDADLSQEFAELTRNQILVKSSAAMVGQSNLMPRSVLQLLG